MRNLFNNGFKVNQQSLFIGLGTPHKGRALCSNEGPINNVLFDQSMSETPVGQRLSSDVSRLHARPKANPGLYQLFGKRSLDLALTLLSLPVVLPIMLFCALALMVEGGAPFYTQERLGRNGKRFRILKLRTMVRDADARLKLYLAQDPALRHEWETTQKLKNDPRITRIGRILRMTSLDELPQLWNVIKGEMSLVGPRPMMTDQEALYGDATDYFDLKPGLTGLWQVSARNESTFAFRAKLDSEYRRSLGLGTDLGLIVRTFGVIVKGTGY